MKQKVIAIGFILFLFTAVVAFSSAETEGPARLDNSVFENPHRTGSVFDHDGHNEMAEIEDCAVCHHVYDGKTLVADESSEDNLCSDCHSQKAGLENSIPLDAAFHQRCRNCHFEKNKGPVLCGECHKKQDSKEGDDG